MCLSVTGELNIAFSGEFLQVSRVKDFPLTKDIADLLPIEENARAAVLRNSCIAEYVMRLVDAHIEDAMRAQYGGGMRLLTERSVMADGRMTNLHSMRHNVLVRWLSQRLIVMPSSIRRDNMMIKVDVYLNECRRGKRRNKGQLLKLLEQM